MADISQVEINSTTYDIKDATARNNKQDKATAVTHTESTAVGSATQPVYIASDGTATATTCSLAKSVPADAKFTDTTYSAATQSANGLMSASDKTKLDGVATGATANTGTVTSVAVQMNGSVKGTVTGSGTIDLGTVLTAHQDISGKQDKLTAGSNITISGTTISATDTNTWRGIQDNLTSSSNTTESLSAKQGYLLANGSARDSTKAYRAHYGTTASSNKYVLVTINKYTSWMLNFTLRLYQSYTATDIQISGYNYGSSHWYTPQARVICSTSTGAVKVYFGYTDSFHLWVAVDGSNYTGADVLDAVNGYTQIDLADAFTVSVVSSLPGTTQTTVTAYRPYYRDETVSNASSASSAASASTTTPTTSSLKNIYAGTSDMTAGTTALTTGTIYLVYE